MTSVATTVSDTFILAERSVKRIARQPDLWTAFTIQPIMFVLLFAYVFGGAISVPGVFGDYKDFLMPGIIVQAMAFGGFVTALSIAEDMQRGLIDRFRSLPMSRIAVLSGRTLADVSTNVVQLVIMIAAGYVVGFAFSSSAPEVIGGLALCLLIGYAFSWVFAWIGLLVSSPESANAFGFILIFPLTFLSSAFVPPGHPSRAAEDLRARHQPVLVHGRCRPGPLPRDPGRQRRLGHDRVVHRPDRGVQHPLRDALQARGVELGLSSRPAGRRRSRRR